ASRPDTGTGSRTDQRGSSVVLAKVEPLRIVQLVAVKVALAHSRLTATSTPGRPESAYHFSSRPYRTTWQSSDHTPASVMPSSSARTNFERSGFVVIQIRETVLPRANR